MDEWAEEGNVAEEVRLDGPGVEGVGYHVLAFESIGQLVGEQDVGQLRCAVDS